MRYRVANLGDVPGFECNGDVCRRIVKPAPGYVAPARTVTQKEAGLLANLVSQVIENNPSCFEGEDLSVAYSIASKLQDFSQSDQVTLALSDEEARVAGRAESCNGAAGMMPTPFGIKRSGSAPIAASQGPAPLPQGPSPFPIVPVAIGAGALGLLALVISIVK
jgi:hypothetical protein